MVQELKDSRIQGFNDKALKGYSSGNICKVFPYNDNYILLKFVHFSSLNHLIHT